MKFFTYIVNWNEVYNNVLEIEKQFKDNNIPHKIINSGVMNHDDWLNVGDIRYYRQLYTAVKDFDHSYEYMFWLAGDVSFDSWKDFISKADSVVSAYNVWAYAPHLTHEPWNEGSSKIVKLDSDKNILLSIQTDGIAVILHRDVVLMLKEYFDFLSQNVDLKTFTSGWGMDMIWCSYAIYNDKLILRDNKYILNHPAGSSYNHDKASAELKEVLNNFYNFCDSKGIDSNRIKEIHEKIYGRMQRLDSCMTIESFYGHVPQIAKNEHEINYHTIFIDDTRKVNRDIVDATVNGNKVDIKCLNAKSDGQIDLFKQDNPEFKIIWDGFKVGELGNFGSHYLAWKYLKNSNLDRLLIFEDDITIDHTFVEKYHVSLSAVPENYDVLSIYVDPNQYERFNESQTVNYYVAKGYQDWSTLCYVISKQGAEKLCNYVEEIGMDHPTDWFIFRKGQQGIFNVYTLPPYVENPLGIDKQYESQVQ